MAEFRLTRKALSDLRKIEEYLQREASADVAAKVEDALFRGFEELVRLTFVGHHREDVRQSDLLFYTVFDCLIAFRREPRVIIVRVVVHGARNIPRIL